MTVLIDIRTEGFPEELEAVMEKIALDSLKYEGFQEECEISISIVDNEEIHQINKQFRGIDRPTDVLSFPQLTFEEGEIMDRNENGEVVLTTLQRLFRKCVCRLHTTHGFHHDCDLRIVFDNRIIMYDLIFHRISRKFTQIQDILDRYFVSYAFCDTLFVYF